MVILDLQSGEDMNKKIIREYPNSFDLPYRIKRLGDIAHNLVGGNAEAVKLFTRPSQVANIEPQPNHIFALC